MCTAQNGKQIHFRERKRERERGICREIEIVGIERVKGEEREKERKRGYAKREKRGRETEIEWTERVQENMN